MKDKYLLLTKCIINTMFYIGIPITISIPFFLKWYSHINSYYADNLIIQSFLFVVCGIFSCLIVYELKNMIKSVEADNCFIEENVNSLTKMGTYSFIVMLMCAVRLFLYFTPGAFALVIVFAICGLFSKVLSSVFAAAVAYKEENDMTI